MHRNSSTSGGTPLGSQQRDTATAARRSAAAVQTVALATVATLSCVVPAQAGTAITPRTDLRTAIEGTTLQSIDVTGPVEPFRAPSRMEQILSYAPLTLREWASVFDVSHTAIKHWRDGQEPERDEVDRVLGALREAAPHHADLVAWLQAPLPGMSVQPLDLLRKHRWTAFRGAVRTRSAPTVDVATEELLRRRRRQASWAVADVPVVPDDE